MIEEPFVASDPRQVDKRRKKLEDQAEQESAELRALLQLPEFRRYLWRHLSQCGIFRSSLNPSGSMVYFNEGLRSCGLAMWAEVVAADESAILLLLREGKAGAAQAAR